MAVVLAATAMLAACSETEGDALNVTEEPAAITGGPLEIQSGGGMTSLFAPSRNGGWTGNFAVPICLNSDASESVKLKSVSYLRGAGRGTVLPWVRTVAREDVGSNSAGFTTAKGSVEDAIRPYGGELSVPGETQVELKCSDVGAGGYVDLITSVQVGSEGLAINELELTYEYAGAIFTAQSQFAYVACGSAQDPQICTPEN